MKNEHDDKLISRQCRECGGRGEIEVDIYRHQGFTRDIGYIDTKWQICDVCDGDGEIDYEDDEE